MAGKGCSHQESEVRALLLKVSGLIQLPTPWACLPQCCHYAVLSLTSHYVLASDPYPALGFGHPLILSKPSLMSPNHHPFLQLTAVAALPTICSLFSDFIILSMF